MDQDKAENVVVPEHDDVLGIAWKRTLDIGSVSTKYKQQYTALRKVAIVLSLLTTFFAVLIGLYNPNFLDKPWMLWFVAMIVFIPSLAYFIGYGVLYRTSKRRDKPAMDQWINKHPITFLVFIVMVALTTWAISTIDFEIFSSVNNSEEPFAVPADLEFFFRFVVLALPVLGSAVVLYARNFASSIWIDYRVQAEVIRSEIYTYRIKKHLNVNESSVETARADLLRTVASASEELASLPNPIPYLQHEGTTQELVERIHKESYDNNPMDALSIENYIQVRVRDQKNWYASRVERDHKNLQNYFILGQGVAVFGALLSGFDLVHLVAITASITTALSLTSDINMYGATYGLFHLTAVRLENALTNWHGDANNSKDPARILGFVETIEAILANEREVWEKQSKQLQAQAQQGIDNSNIDPNDTDMDDAVTSIVPSAAIRTTSETAVLNPDDDDNINGNGNSSNGIRTSATELAPIDSEQGS